MLEINDREEALKEKDDQNYDYDVAKVPKELQLPYLRLKLEYTGYGVIRSRDLNRFLEGKIANIKDFLHFYKKQGMLADKKQRKKS